MNFKRPENLKYPTTYYTFKAKNRDNNEIIEYRVQDLTEEYFDKTIDMFEKYFIADEEICRGIDFKNSANGMSEMKTLWLKLLNVRFSIGCFTNDGSEELVGVNILLINCKDDPEKEINFTDKCTLDFLRPIFYVAEQFNAYEEFKIDKYLNGCGLVIHKAYRGRGIATEILKARIPMLKALELTVTSTIFTGIGSQTAAKNAGFKDYYVKRYNDLKQSSPEFNFLNTKCEFIKTMALIID